MLKKSKKSNLHRGELLKKITAESNLSVGDIVSRMGYSSRNTFYSHLKKHDLSLALLKRYGRVLHYDFSTNIEEMSNFKFAEEIPLLKPPVNQKDATNQRDYYHRLYMELLEEKRKLEEENAALKKSIKVSGIKK